VSAIVTKVPATRSNGRWLASADTVDGPSLGWGMSAFDALWQALELFDGVIDELLASFPSTSA
jgi:hypothetical protein